MSQNFENHARTVPAFHFVALPILLVNVLWSFYRMIRWFSWENALAAAVAVALVLVAIYARNFALSVQDRVIRLEMALRLEKLLPADLKPRIGDLTVNQFVSLRFASDAELPALTRKVLDEKLNDRKTIKQMIKEWKADELRA
jgi:hypothetical protein